jgi:hypothetical protein
MTIGVAGRARMEMWKAIQTLFTFYLPSTLIKGEGATKWQMRVVRFRPYFEKAEKAECDALICQRC